MQAIDLTVIFALMATLAWGFSDFFAAKASKSIGPVLSIMLISILELPIFLIFYFLHSHNLHFGLNGSLYAVGAGLTFLVASICFFKALEKGPVSLVSPISSTYPLITTLLVVLVFKARLTFFEFIGMSLVILGVMAASGVTDNNKQSRRITPGIRLAIITSLVWGLGFSLLAQAVKDLGWLNASFVEICADTVFACFLVPLLMNHERLSFREGTVAIFNKFIWLNTVLGLSGLILLEIAISKSTYSGGAVATAVSSTYPILTILLALRHFKEKVRPLALSGALLGVIGVLFLAI